MNLYFRLILVIIKAFFRPKMKLDDISTISFRVMPHDLDLNFHMNNGRYLTLMDLGRLDLTVRTGLLGAFFKYKWQPLVASETIRFRRALAPFQKFDLSTRFIGWQNHWLFMEQTFIANSEIVAVAYVKAVFKSKKGKVNGEEIAKALNIPAKSKDPGSFIDKWLEFEHDSKSSYYEIAKKNSGKT